MVDACPFEGALPTVLHQLRLLTCRRGSETDETSDQAETASAVCADALSPPTCKQHQPKAPVGVPQRAAAQENLLVVQRVFLTSER